MSLFGGSAPTPRSSYESDNSVSSSVHTPPSVVESEPPRATIEIQTLDALYPTDAEDGDIGTTSHAESDESDEGEEEEPGRPNKFSKHAQTWLDYTELDRQIVESLDQMEDEDLTAHLYNTHALKRRLRRPAQELAQLKSWQGRNRWLKTGKDLEYTDAAGFTQTALVPPKEWTGWPVVPEELLDLEDESGSGLAGGQSSDWTIGSADDSDWTIGSADDAVDDLDEELLAVYLRLAKKQWDRREADLSESDAEEHAGTPRNQSRAGSTRSAISRPTSRADRETNPDDQSDDEKYNTDYKSTSGKQRGRKAYSKTLTEPTMLADDAEARRLLRPTIQSMKSKLDELALAIYRTRQNHTCPTPGESSMSDFTSGSELSRPTSRNLSKAGSQSVTSRESGSRPSSRAGPSRDDHTTRQGTSSAESDDSSSDASDDDTSSSRRPKRKRRRSLESSSDIDDSTDQEEHVRKGLIDWSEVLGLAAVQGWDQGAIARTAQRCATLFDESMSFMSFPESLATKRTLEPVIYTPSAIPAAPVPSIAREAAPTRPFFQRGTLRCPHTDCWGHEKEFAIPYRTIEHCMRTHGYDPRENKTEDEETIAGGFLKPVTLRQAWSGNSRSKSRQASKRPRSGQKNSRASSEVGASVEE
ncbi:hypothetical protein GMOD_00007107 [Pyrenophora seminiperda CCB06]|uniref:Rrn9 domain-containing protein n=1 Tax=Pyrenophora seminiperda CCB06 TaxID=1302712 RepID=A0A3M7MC78_9PLEO|nr:hypothetical protein GMOD_00007107 [Pyrenophora seminiperda CCB06]